MKPDFARKSDRGSRFPRGVPFARRRDEARRSVRSDKEVFFRLRFPHIAGFDRRRLGESVAVAADLRYVEKALALLHKYVANYGMRPDLAQPNDLGALLLLARAYQALRLATYAALTGNYTEVWSVLRSAHEAIGLSRYVAKNLDRADAWQRGAWIKDAEVRSGLAKESADSYAALSEQAHPSFASVQPVSRNTHNGQMIWADLGQHIDQQEVRHAVTVIAGEAIWACWALKNATVSEDFIHPRWLRELSGITREFAAGHDSPYTFSHLDRDWDALKEAWNERWGRQGAWELWPQSFVVFPGQSYDRLGQPKKIGSD